MAGKYSNSNSNQQSRLAEVPSKTLGGGGGGGCHSPLTTESCYLYTVRVTHLESLSAAEANWLCGPGTDQNLCFFGNFQQE